MAITKIHGIKSTVSKAIDYICDKEKTDDKILISSFATAPETAANDFKFTLSHTNDDTGNQAYHLIQSFLPGEVTPEAAHEIAEELAERILQSKYSYVISTHIDKGHVHNHIIFCSANNIDYSKYHDCKATYHQIRRISDTICAEHNLSIIEANQHKSEQYKSWQANKNGTSWKAALKTDIRNSIRASFTYEEFLSLMRQKGYEIKDSEFTETAHKYIAFRAPGQERWIRGRAKSLGEKYTKEKIKESIEEKARIKTEKMIQEPTSSEYMIDTSNERFADSPLLKKWADKQNLKTAARIQSKLAEMGCKSLTDVDAKIKSLHQQAKEGKKTTIQLDKEIKVAAEIVTFARQYKEKARFAKFYQKSKDPERYYQNHSYDIHLAWGAADILKKAGIDPDKMNLQEIENHYKRLCADRQNTSNLYKQFERECAKLKKSKELLLDYIGKQQNPDLGKENVPQKDLS